MLHIYHSVKDLVFSQLMDVYEESNTLSGREQYQNKPLYEQLREVEQDFYNYLNSVFFRQDNSFYAVWIKEGKYVSALRLEPYINGILLCALETAPNERNKGYAHALILSVLDYVGKKGNRSIYSHVSKKNVASLNVHLKSGFRILKDHAVYSDGSVATNCYTLVYEYKGSET